VDVLSKIPLELLLAEHQAARDRAEGRLLATLAVQDRGAERQLLFDDAGLMGWEHRGRDGVVRELEEARAPVGPLRRWSFSGIHVVEPIVFDLCEQLGRFPIRTLYLDLARRGFTVQAVDVSAYAWLDAGTPQRLEEAERQDW
jgi:NDP-sugar pyrophosphorylase family protein